jgi:hypothetical protein
MYNGKAYHKEYRQTDCYTFNAIYQISHAVAQAGGFKEDHETFNLNYSSSAVLCCKFQCFATNLR